MLRRVVRELTTAGCPAWRASRCARAAVPARAFGTSAAARTSATPSSEEPEIAFDPRVDTYTERRRAWESQLNALRKEWAADFKARADAKAAEVQSAGAAKGEDATQRPKVLVQFAELAALIGGSA